jgi:NADH dehydrogenase (ubiquinone) 1 beta subcomplex subunit 9
MSSIAAVHRLQVQSLYKRSLKLSLDWYIQRDLWRQKALEIRARFEQNKNVTNPKEIRALLKKTENELKEWAHPDPYRRKQLKKERRENDIDFILYSAHWT